MKPFYKTSEFWLNLLLAGAGAVAGMQGLPGSVTQIAGLAAMALAAILHTTARTVLKVQDSAEQAAASIKVPLPPVLPIILLAIGLGLLQSCAIINPKTPAQCTTSRQVTASVAGVLGSGSVATAAASLATQAGATSRELADVALACSAVAVGAVTVNWVVDNVLCPAPMTPVSQPTPIGPTPAPAQ